MEIQAGGVILAADFTRKSSFVVSEPLLYLAVATADVADVSCLVGSIPAPHVFPLVLASFFGVFVRHKLWVKSN
jgi:ABC-type anion transport system duplicated permease subunit